jgi:hypothetical protein
MINEVSLLVTLVKLVDHLPKPAPSPNRERGRPQVYPDQLFLKALVVMIVKHLHTINELRNVLAEPTPEMQYLQAEFTLDGHYPTRRTWERRLGAIPTSLPAQIALLGQHLVNLLNPWPDEDGQAAAIDSTLLRAKGGVWHKKDREKGVVPHTSIDTEAHWTKSGWHGWVYGYKLHLVATVAKVWIPLAAQLTPANEADNVKGLDLLEVIPSQVHYLLGDTHYNDPALRQRCEQTGRVLVATRRGVYPHTDAGCEVRKVFHQLRTHTIENFNEQFKAIFDGHGSVPTKGLKATRRWALGAIFVYQLALLYRYQNGQTLRRGLKSFLKAA